MATTAPPTTATTPAPAADAAATQAAASSATKPPSAGAPYRSAALYVGDLHADCTEATLFEIFNAVAPVASVRVCRHAITRRSLGYAYVNFHTVRDAERVLDTMNYTMIKGRMCRLMWSQRDPSLRKSGQGNVFIKNLEPSIDSKDLFDTFSIFGNIISCKVVTGRDGKSKGYGFVHFETQEDADEAIAKVNGNKISGLTVYVGNFVKRDQRMDSQQWTNLYVKNIPLSWDEKKLNELFVKYGPISSAIIVKNTDDAKDGAPVLQFGYVDFEQHESAVTAVEDLHGLDLGEGEKENEAENETTEAEDEEAKQAKAARTLYVQRFMKKRERERVVNEAKVKEKTERIKQFLGKNLYVRNLADEVTDEQLRAEFAAFGTITSARVMRDEKNGSRSRGFGFVCFSTREEAAKALHTLNNMMFMGKPLYVAMWQPREERRQFLQRQHMAKRGAAQMGGRAMMPPMGLGYQMGPGPLGMYPQAGGPGYPRGQPRPMYNMGQRMPPQGGYQVGGPAAYGAPGIYGSQMMQMARGPRGQPMQRGQRGGRRGPQGQQQQAQAKQQFQMAPPHQMTQQARNTMQQQQQQQQQQPMPPQQQMPPQQTMPADNGVAALTPAALAAASPADQKNMIGERLYPLVHVEQPDLAGKVTGMLLDGMETAELLHLLESPEALRSKIQEAMEVLAASAAQDDE